MQLNLGPVLLEDGDMAMQKKPLDMWYFNYVWKGVLCKRLQVRKKKSYNLFCLLVAKW